MRNILPIFELHLVVLEHLRHNEVVNVDCSGLVLLSALFSVLDIDFTVYRSEKLIPEEHVGVDSREFLGAKSYISISVFYDILPYCTHSI